MTDYKLTRRNLLLSSMAAAGITASTVAAAHQKNKAAKTLSLKFQVGGEIGLDKKTVKKRPANLTKDDDDYWCYVTNKSDWTITHVHIVATGEEAPIRPPIGRNCPDNISCDEALDQGKYDAFMFKSCLDNPAEFKLRLRKGNEEGYTDPFLIEPDCEYAGVVLCLIVA